MSSQQHPLSNAFLKHCYEADAAYIRRRLFRLRKEPDSDKKTAALEKLATVALESRQKVEQRLANRPSITYPDSLPVSQKRDEIANAIAANQVVIVAGETGSGKTTQLPKICLELGLGSRGLIGHTQPRRLAARSVATRIAEEMNTPLGEAVGFKVRFADAINDTSYIKLMTDGILLAELTNDKFLNQYDTIIIDEAHERSLNIDFILGYLKSVLKKRPDLKVIITSATIDVERFSKHFNNAPVIEVSGRTYPVETRYRPLVQDQDDDLDLIEGIFAATDELMQEGLGDILIFMNGEREIRDVAEQLNRRNYRDTEILPLYARLSYGEQSKVFKSHVGRRIVLATNVAETSLTVPGIRYVIDPGTARISRYSYRTKVQRLPIEPISQASANQRQGRCGRVAPGICIRLYSEDDFVSRPEFTDPEILRTNLASVILKMLSIGLGDIEGFPFIQPPDARYIRDGFLLLEELQAVVKKKGRLDLTQLGRQLAHIPVDPRLARMVIEAQQNGCLHEALVITAGLSIQDPRERPMDKKQAADQAHNRFTDKDSDFVSWLNLWDYLKESQKQLSSSQFRKQCKTEFLAYLRVREWQDLYTQLRQATHELKWKLNSPAEELDYEGLHRSLLTGLLSHIGFKDKDNEYLGARNRRFFVFPGSPLAKKGPKWIMAAELTETSRLFARCCAKIQPEWIEPLASHLVKKNYVEPHFESKQGSVVALENQVLYGLQIVNRRKVQYGPVEPVEAREIFIRSALADGELRTNEAFFIKNQKLLLDIETLEHKSRRRDILVDEQALYAFYEPKIPDGIYNAPKFLKWWKTAKKATPDLLDFERESLMQRSDEHISALDFPEKWHKGNLALKVSYHFEPSLEDDGVSVHIPVALINQIDDSEFDWNVPGLREEKCIALIKSLPKALRRNFVPAPDYAKACLQAMTPFELPLIDAMCKQLLRMSGTRISPEDFDQTQLAKHLLVNFKIEGDKGKLLAQGRELEPLKASMQGQVVKAIRRVADSGIEQKGLEQWTFGDLPKQFEQRKGNFEVKAFPALVDDKTSVSIKLFDDEFEAQKQHRIGLQRLLLLNIPSPVKHLQKSLPNKAKLAMYFNPFGQVNILIDDILSAAVQQLLDEKGIDVRSETAFSEAKDWVRQELNPTAEKIALKVEEILTIYNRIKKRLKGKISLDIAFAMSDIQSQLDQLVFKGFVEHSGWQRLTDLIRYLKGIENRLEKLPVDPNRDRLHMLSINKVQDLLKAQLAKLPKSQPVPDTLAEARWMIEEYRVSCFAQVLGTAYPISEKRILNQIAQA
ncbi:ATP-dependent RNA helicase HrpA [Shewanella fidelis]|uniref:RNA helicase n=1 Tax=Shewanella fidelis TaxID=173509 RepID=A0AAW8NLI1_9GAMM|nr:ATP-dependent RNA helicase HrpA [Shewanella fidelis]MDR8524093.1 ATP-dependent RNA helicase HrpA [Shewanella fidelis]MDW4810640.1 ATP-dependent RNA helicase HrpA [Shewanella fidelis]MDW4814761.1 ATP-dependent RNA helicase HrpA [Shewanella fidelis]MDW4818851.1 ATP-dependent RNA helicase HrpA [Shewanella fidelis]MDW4823472.1 ATP-dependent RNA helicase HrpA [Shewanella fidelis]